MKYDLNSCCRQSRRTFLADMGLGFTGLALSAMLQRDGIAREPGHMPPDGKPHHPPKAKSVIWIFLIGGLSHMESFDPKPAIKKYGNMSIDDTEFKNVLTDPYLNNLRVVGVQKKYWKTIFPLQVGFGKRGQSGIEVSDHWPHVSSVIDDIAVIRSMWTTDDNHGAQLQFHTGRHMLDGLHPTLGAWAHYGLGSLNDDLPQFVVLGETLSERFGGKGGHRADYLGPEHDGVPIQVDPREPLMYGTPGRDVSRQEQQGEFELLNDLNHIAGIEYPDDANLRARIKSYEMAYRMQMSVPEVMRFSDETQETQHLYGLDNPKTRKMGETLLASRRLVERGTRFVQIYDGPQVGMGKWDQHESLRKNLTENAYSVDQPIAALLKDLKRRGMLDDTLVCCMTEFGRSPGGQGNNATGREHHPYAFSVWMAGGGIKGGIVHGRTDELGFHAVENRHYVTDIHATVLHQLGLDPRRLVVPGRQRLEVDFGNPIREIMK